MNWQQLWEKHKDIFKGTDWEECSEENIKAWKLSPHFRYFSAGDMNLTLGIILAERTVREEDLLSSGLLWGNRIINGIHTVIYFVAPGFSSVFLKSLQQIKGKISAKAVLWREKLYPHFFIVTEGSYLSQESPFFSAPKPNWSYWEKKCNPVAQGHLRVVQRYFAGLESRRVRTVFRKNAVLFLWGNAEIAEVALKGDSFILKTKTKWLKAKESSPEWQREGWVDIDGCLDKGFQRAVDEMLSLLETKEQEGSLSDKDVLALKIWHVPHFIAGEAGESREFPLLKKDHTGVQPEGFYYFLDGSRLMIYYPVLDRTMERIGEVLFYFAALQNNKKELWRFAPGCDLEWQETIGLLTTAKARDELRWVCEFFRYEENFPISVLPEDWKTP